MLKAYKSFKLYLKASQRYKNDPMLSKVFNDESSWYNRDADRLECDQEKLMFFGVSAKQTDRINMELEVGYPVDCKTEEIDGLIRLEHESIESDRSFPCKRPLFDHKKPQPFVRK